MLIIWEHDLYYFHNHIDSKNKTIQCTDNWKAINNIEQVLFVIIDIILFIHINTIAKWQDETTNYKRKSGKRKGKERKNNMLKHGPKSLTQQKRKDQLNKHEICDIISFDGISL